MAALVSDASDLVPAHSNQHSDVCQPLEPGITYRVTITATAASGVVDINDITFTTRSQ